MLIEPSIYLAKLLHDFYNAGGKLVVKEFRGRQEIMRLPEPVIFNCTGLERISCSATKNSSLPAASWSSWSPSPRSITAMSVQAICSPDPTASSSAAPSIRAIGHWRKSGTIDTDAQHPRQRNEGF